MDDDAEEIAEIPDGDEPAGPPKKKRKKKKKSKDASRDEVPDPENRDDAPHLSTSTAELGVTDTEPTPVPEISVIPEEGGETHKKKKKSKKSASQEKWKLEQRQAIAKEMAKALHRPIQHKQDFRAIRKYQKGLSPDCWRPLTEPTIVASCWRRWS